MSDKEKELIYVTEEEAKKIADYRYRMRTTTNATEAKVYYAKIMRIIEFAKMRGKPGEGDKK